MVDKTAKPERETAVGSLSQAEAHVEWQRLAEAVAAANRAYHTEDAPEISDAEYDRLKRRLATIEARFPALAAADPAITRASRRGRLSRPSRWHADAANKPVPLFCPETALGRRR